MYKNSKMKMNSVALLLKTKDTLKLVKIIDFAKTASEKSM